MRKIDKQIYIVGKKNDTLVKIDPHSIPKIEAPSTDGDEWCNWGDDNLYPKRLMEKVGMVGTAVGGLRVLRSAHYGSGLKIFELIPSEGEAIFKEKVPSEIPKITEFFDRTQFELIAADLISDYETFGIAFPEFLLSPNGEEIISVVRHQASFCRFEKPKNGQIQNVFINTAWGESLSEGRAIRWWIISVGYSWHRHLAWFSGSPLEF